ncbi:sigma D regulator [Aliivibrio kagoshimensis]|uniref:sigma D regulator n=1 Tax=Aliivibrio kagoshimensis TaxID=2910230 RepID=UPI003D096C9F
MLTKLNLFQEQWKGSSSVIDHWLDTRQELIVNYCKLAGLPPFESKELPTVQNLQSFNQQLIDYISEGHFKIYDQVIEQWNATGYSPTEEISQIYSKISLTTDSLLNFTEKYTDCTEEKMTDSFDADLSSLGELIEIRFEFEDSLIQLISSSLAHPPGA